MHAQPIHSSANRLYTRRKLLLRAAALGAAAGGLPWLLAACGGDTPAAATPAAPKVGRASAVNCSESPALSGLEAAARQAVNYVDVSSDANRVCSGCRFFKPPQAGTACGGCQIVAGPIAPAGTCSAWVTG